MNIPLVSLVVLIAALPLSSSAQLVGCTVNGIEVPGDLELIEGTGSADIIDCRGSSLTTGLDIYGYGGADIIYGSKYDDFIAGGSGKDTIRGDDGDDSIDGGGDDDTIHGEGGDAIIFGGVGASPASGVGCALQTVPIPAGSSYLTKGGSGDDTIYGGIGNDCINAGSGEDVVYGGDGYDTIVGGNHSDLLDGGLDKDFIDGGWHTDTCVDSNDSNDDDKFFNCELFVESAPFCGDGIRDPGEDSCSCPEDCGAPPLAEDEGPAYCADEWDNDCDGDIDCDDSDCSGDEACQGCEPIGSSCDSNSDCCSNKCKGKSGSKTCK